MTSPNSCEFSYPVPDGLLEILEEFSTEVLRRRPQNIYACLAEYCNSKLQGKGQMTMTSSQGVKDKLSSVIAQSLQLVQKLEQMQNEGPRQEPPPSFVSTQGQTSQGQGETSQGQGQTSQGQGQTSQGQGQGLSHQDICNQIHCLVKLMDQLSMQYDTLIGNPSCPYHQGHNWMPQCGTFMEAGHSQLQEQEWAGYGVVSQQQGFEFGAPIPVEMIPVGDGGACPEDWDDPSCADYIPQSIPQGYVDPNSFYGSPGGNQDPPPAETGSKRFQEENKGFPAERGGGGVPESTAFSPSQVPAPFSDPPTSAPLSPPPGVSQLPKSEPLSPGPEPKPVSPSPIAAAISASATAVAASALRQSVLELFGAESPIPSASSGSTSSKSPITAASAASAAASTFIPAVTQSVLDLFGADKEGAIETTLKSINESISNVMFGAETYAGIGQWYSVIQEFLSNQLTLIQQLLTGQMPLTDAPYEVAFLTVAFLMGLIVGYKQIHGAGWMPGAEGVIKKPFCQF